jgi:hypothetical protein
LGNAINDDVLAEVGGLIGSDDLKFHFIKTFWRRGFSFEQTRFAAII